VKDGRISSESLVVKKLLPRLIKGFAPIRRRFEASETPGVWSSFTIFGDSRVGRATVAFTAWP